MRRFRSLIRKAQICRGHHELIEITSGRIEIKKTREGAARARLEFGGAERVKRMPQSARRSLP
jgi:hypothetical protein